MADYSSLGRPTGVHNPQAHGAIRDLVNLAIHHKNNGIGNASIHPYNLSRRPNVNARAVTFGIRQLPIHHRGV